MIKWHSVQSLNTMPFILGANMDKELILLSAVDIKPEMSQRELALKDRIVLGVN